MAASSARIDELVKKFDENPRRYFAPLANEYRKAGDLEQAIFICQEYLPQQPGHMSGHIVYGQALFELGRHDEAKTVFETALSLDPENLIALRHLGDIARQAGDPNAARGWYQRVLEADPRNEEIAQIMMSLITTDAPAAPPPPAPTTDDAAPPVAESAEQFASAGPEPTPASVAAPSQASPPDIQPPPVPEAQRPDASLVDVPFGIEKSTEAVIDVPPPLPVQEEGESTHAPNEHELLDLDAEAFDLGSPSAEPDQASRYTAPAAEQPHVASDDSTEPPIDMATDLNLGLPDDGVASTAPAGADAPLDGLETFENGVIASASQSGAPTLETESFFETPPTPDAPAATQSDAAEVAPEPVGAQAPVTPAETTQQAFVTETMAELYLQQGHTEAALDIYRRLVELRPDDASLQDKVDEIERGIFGTSAQAASEETAVPAPVVAAPTAYGGPTIRDFLLGLLMGHASSASPESAAPSPPLESVATELADEPLAYGSDEILAEAVGEPPVHDSMEPEPARPELRPTPSSANTVSESLDVFFGGAETTDDDDQAAATLAEAFAPEGPATAPLEGLPAHRATNELSLDHVFKSGGPRASGEQDGFSFDQFFSAETSETTTPPAEESAGASPETTDDIAQFNAWLNGLKKT